LKYPCTTGRSQYRDPARRTAYADQVLERVRRLPGVAAWRASQKRKSELREIGIGIGSVHTGLGAAAEVIRNSAPAWRRKQEPVLRELFAEFLRQPTAELFTGVVVGAHALLASISLEHFLEADGD
jgi:hypothetical protein